jgi:sRNA-binding carbon storage regulator CsrA
VTVLVLSRRPGQSVRVGSTELRVVHVKGDHCLLEVGSHYRTLEPGQTLGPVEGVYVRIAVGGLDQGRVRLGFSGPRDVPILRTELLEPR